MHYLYIIYSPSANRYYTGETNNVPARLELHNSHKNIKAYTKAASDWKLQFIYNCNSREDAVYLERFIKRMKSKKFIQKVIDDSTILEDILKKR